MTDPIVEKVRERLELETNAGSPLVGFERTDIAHILNRLRTLEARDNGTTHWEGCYADGPRHYRCAVEKVERIRAWALGQVRALEREYGSGEPLCGEERDA